MIVSINSRRKNPRLKISYLNCYELQKPRDVLDNILKKERNSYSLIEKLAYKEIFLEYFKNKSKILDAGGGWGRHALTLYKLGHNVTVIDFSKQQIRGAQYYLRALHKINNIKILKREIDNKSEFCSGYFNHIICLDSILSCGDYYKILKEFSRLLNKGGYLVASVASKSHIAESGNQTRDKGVFNKHGLILCSKAKEINIGECFIKTFTSDELHNIMAQFKLEILTMCGLEKAILKTLDRKINNIHLVKKGYHASRLRSEMEDNIIREFSSQVVFIARKK